MADSRRFISTYLDSPIIQNERDKFLMMLLSTRSGEKVDCHRSEKRKIDLLLAKIEDRDLSCLDPHLYPSLDQETVADDAFEILETAYELGSTVFNQASEGARAWGMSSGLGTSMFSLKSLPPYALQWYYKHRLWHKIVMALAISRSQGSRGMIEVTSGNLEYYGDEYFGILTIEGIEDVYLISYMQTLMFKDLYYARFNVAVGCMQIYKSLELLQKIKECLDWFFKCIAVYGNKGYELAKGIESLTKANLIRKYDPYLGSEGSFDVQLDNMIAKEKKWGVTTSFLSHELSCILDCDLPMAQMVELFGLQKLSGHPLLDPSVGGRSVREESSKKIDYSILNVERLRNNCCRLYLEGFIRSKNDWPPLEFPPNRKHTKLYQLYSLREMKINRSSYDISDWTDVKFKAHHEFDYYPNFMDLMDDKSISFYREEAAATWNSKMKTRSHKRLLIEMLSRPEISIRSIVERVRIGDIPFSWMIVSLYPKEREFKIAARMFSMMVFEMRAYFTAIEANIADKVFPLLPQQTMTLGKQEIQELFHKITHGASGEDLEKLYLEVDLTRWNLRWHPEVVDPVGRDLDDMFGLPGLFTTIHHFFSKCMILIRVPSCKPEGIDLERPPETDLCFYNHEVGFEGIGQKQWTFLTYGMIDLGLDQSVGRYYLIGQADNQIILMTIDCSDHPDKSSYLRRLAQGMVKRIEHECALVGQEAKAEECLQSTQIVTYSKDVYIGGVEYFTSLKAVSRVFPHSASDFPSVDGSIGAISGQCLAAAERMKLPFNAFSLWCFHASLYFVSIRSCPTVETSTLSDRLLSSITDRVVVGLLILPGELGGTQIAPVTSFFYKGGADPLSKAYASLKFYQHSQTMVRKFSYCLIKGLWFEREPDVRGLLEDPYSLPLRRPQTAENAVYKQSLSTVNSLTRNRDIKEITSAKVNEYREELLSHLLSCNPLNPVLLSDILAWSIVGTQDTISRMFTSTRTVQSLVQTDAESVACSRILAVGAGHFLSTLLKLQNCGEGEHVITSIYDDISTMRDFWLSGRTQVMAGVTSYVPFDLKIQTSRHISRIQGFKAFFPEIKKDDPLHTRGPEDPYLGRATKEKRADYGYRIVTSSAPERAVKRLADIATQPGVESSFRKLITEVAKSRANVDLDEVYPLVGQVVGGCIAHRYGSRMGHRSACGLGSMSIASHCIINTDDAAPISGGEDDYPVMVQEFMLTLVLLCQVHASVSRDPLFSALITDSVEFQPLPSQPLSGPEKLSIPSLYLQGNVLATADEIFLRRTHGPALSPFTQDAKCTGSKGLPYHYGMRRVALRALTRTKSLMIIADRGAGSAPFKIDLLELRGTGVRTTLQAISTEIASLAVEVLFAKSCDDLRWTPLPFMISLAQSFSEPLARLLCHPMFSDHEYVVNGLRISPMKYEFSTLTIKEKIKSDLTRLAVHDFTDPSSATFTDMEVLFSDDLEDSVSRTVIRRLKIILFQAAVIGQCSSTQVFSIIRRNIPRSLRSEHTEKGRLEALHRLIVGLSAWAKDESLVFLSEHLRALSRGEMISVSFTPAVSLLRDSRQENESPREAPIPRSQKHVFPEMTDISLVEYSEAPGSSPFLGFKERFNRKDLEYIEFNIRRLRKRVSGGESSAGYSYVPLIRFCENKICFIIGCGYGSGAAVLSWSGCSHVFGLDLWNDLSESSLLINDTVPPAMKVIKMPYKFSRVPVHADNRGDIRDSRTATLLSSCAGNGSLYIVDVPLEQANDLVRLINTLSLASSYPEVFVRYLGSNEDLCIVTSTLTLSGFTPHIYCVFAYGRFTESWIHFKVPKHILWRAAKIRGHLAVSPKPFPLEDLSYLGGGADFIQYLIEGPYAGLSPAQLTSSGELVAGLLDQSVGELDHRFAYNQWTDILKVHVIRLVRSSKDPISAILSIIREDIIRVSIGPHVSHVAVTPALRRTLTRVLPRIL